MHPYLLAVTAGHLVAHHANLGPLGKAGPVLFVIAIGVVVVFGIVPALFKAVFGRRS